MPTYAEQGYITGGTAGQQVSSTYEGRYVSILESTMVHPTHTDGFVNQGDPIIAGDVVGVAMTSAAAATDYISVDTEGIWNLTVVGTRSDGSNGGGNVAIAVGDQIYADTAVAGLSAESDAMSHRPFGVALAIVLTGASTVIAVKVHGDQDKFRKVNVGVMGVPNTLDVSAYGAGGSNENFISWMDAYIANSSIIEADEGMQGIYVRLNNTQVTDAGSTVAGHFKVVQDAANTTQLTQVHAIKADCDLRGEGAVHQHAIEAICEGACTASDNRSAIRFISRDTVGTLEALFSLELATTFGCSVDTLTTESYAIPVEVAGTLHYIQLYST